MSKKKKKDREKKKKVHLDVEGVQCWLWSGKLWVLLCAARKEENCRVRGFQPRNSRKNVVPKRKEIIKLNDNSMILQS